MTTKTRIISIGTMALAITLGACAKAPEQQIANARTALAAARSAEAEEWAPAEWSEARAAMTALDDELAHQAKKFALTRSYDHASELTATALRASETAQAAAVEGKQAAYREAEAAIESASTALASARDLSTHLNGCRSKPKGFAADMTVVAGTLDALQNQLATARNLIAQEQFRAVSEESDSIRQQVESVTGDLLNVMEKIRCTPPATI